MSASALDDVGRGRFLFLSLISYVVLAIVSFYPQSVRPWDTIAYIGDALESVWVIAWNNHQFFTDPGNIFNANILHPSPQALTYTDHRLGTSLLVAPVVWLTANPVLGYNVAIAFGCVLAAGAAHRLARSLGVSALGSWAAGALYGFNTFQVNEGARLHILYHGFVPLALEQLVRFLKTGRKRHAYFTGAWMFLQALCSSYHVLYGALLLGLVALVAFVARPALFVRRLPTLVLAAALAALLFLPILVPYLESSRVHEFRHEMPTGIDLQHYVTTTPTNLVYGAIGAEFRLQQRAPHFVGFASMVLVVLSLGALAWRKDPYERDDVLLQARIWVPAALALAVVFVALSLGKDMLAFGHSFGPGPYRLLYDWVPGFQKVRIPERLSMVAMLFIALLVGRGISLVERFRAPWLAYLLALFVPLEHLSPLPQTTRIPVTDSVPTVYRWLDEQPAEAVAEVPIHGEALVRKETLEMYFSSYHHKPIIHGYESYPPLITTILRQLALEFPTESSIEGFRRVGVDTVIVHRGRHGSEEVEAKLPEWILKGWLTPLARFAGDGSVVYDAVADEVYRLTPREPPLRAAAYPSGRPFRDPAWQYRATRGDPYQAVDGSLESSWIVMQPLLGDEVFEVDFGEAVTVSGIVLRLRRGSKFPPRFRIVGWDESGQRVRLARYDAAHAVQLLDALMENPGEAALGFDLGGVELTSLSLNIGRGGTRFDRTLIPGWSIPEIEIWVNRDAENLR